MKLHDFTVTNPIHHAWVESGWQYFEVGTRGVQSIDWVADGVIVTIIPEGTSVARSIVFPHQGYGALLESVKNKGER